MSQPLNPNAAEFVPVSPVSPQREITSPIFRNIIDDRVLSQSPKRGERFNVDKVPSSLEFNTEIKDRPSDLELEEHTNGKDIENVRILLNILM